MKTGVNPEERRVVPQPMLILPFLSACAPALSVTLTVNVYVPARVGLPEMEIGNDVERRRPGGSLPEAIDAVYGATPPHTKKFCKYDVCFVPAAQQELGNVIVS
jgi:hypothetical protein